MLFRSNKELYRNGTNGITIPDDTKESNFGNKVFNWLYPFLDKNGISASKRYTISNPRLIERSECSLGYGDSILITPCLEEVH